MIEREWLARLAPALPLAVPVPVATGDPAADYPFPWMVCRWVSGLSVPPDGLDADGTQLLAEFVVALEALNSDGGPAVEPGQRAGSVAAYDKVARAALDAVLQMRAAGQIEPDLINEEAGVEVWEAALSAPAWPAAVCGFTAT